MISVDLNCDMGEGMTNDALIMPHITSANIACGFHAGDDDTMKRTIELALQHNVAIGAHPSFNDKENFGRKEMLVEENELADLISVQIYRITNIASSLGATVHHVKPHGALYNMAARDAGMSRITATTISKINSGLVLYGLSNSHLITEAKKAGLKTAAEVFADRTYQDDGSLTPRSHKNALIEAEATSLNQVLEMVMNKRVASTSGKIIDIEADTICIHGDGTHAVSFAKKINTALKQKAIAIRSI